MSNSGPTRYEIDVIVIKNSDPERKPRVETTWTVAMAMDMIRNQALKEPIAETEYNYTLLKRVTRTYALTMAHQLFLLNCTCMLTRTNQSETARPDQIPFATIRLIERDGFTEEVIYDCSW